MKILTKVAVASALVLSSFAAVAAFSSNMGADALRGEVKSQLSTQSMLNVAVAAKAANVPVEGLISAMLLNTPAETAGQKAAVEVCNLKALESVLLALKDAGYDQAAILKAAADLCGASVLEQAALGAGFSPDLVAEATAAGGDAPGAGGIGGASPGFGAPSNFGNAVGGGGGTTPVSPS